MKKYAEVQELLTGIGRLFVWTGVCPLYECTTYRLYFNTPIVFPFFRIVD